MSRILGVGEADKLVAAALPVAEKEVVQTLEQVRKATQKFGFPVVLKAVSPQLIHKTEAGAVKIAHNDAEIERCYNQLQALKKKHIALQGILVQEFVHGKELIFGIKKDSTFGHAIMFGLGGIYAEVFKEVTFRLCPISEEDAQSMIDDLKSKEFLQGVRGELPVNVKLLKSCLVNLSKLPRLHDIEELDINPFIINHKTGKAVDVRIVLAGGKPRSMKAVQIQPPKQRQKPRQIHMRTARSRKKKWQRKNKELKMVSKFLGIEL